MKTIMIDLPLRVQLFKDKDFILNLNNYRNLHFRSLAKAKVNYFDLIRDRIEPYKDLMIDWPIILRYTLYMPTRTHVDAANPGSIIDKFTADALVTLRVLKDDRMTIVKEVRYRYGGVDKDNPRMVLEILDHAE